MVQFFDSIFPGLGAFVSAIWSLFILIYVLPVRLLLRFIGKAKPRPSKAYISKAKAAENEQARQAGCRDVVLSYANNLGFIARGVITRKEIEARIDGSIAPKELAKEIQSRIDGFPRIMLGEHSYTGYPIKLPYSFRDRHGYIIGKTGSRPSTTLSSNP
jgi:hypothetical protein